MQEQDVKKIGILRINIGESEHAFRINGVTYAKRHLLATMKKREDGDIHKTLARYLTIVPFLATAYTVSENASESIKYGSIKAKRLYKALELNEENTLPFMLFAMSQAGGEDIRSVGDQVRKAGFYEGGQFVPFQEREGLTGIHSQSFLPSSKPTLH